MTNPAARAGLLAFVTASVTLASQVLVHRMVSAKLLNNFAFLVISLTMLGFAFSGVVLTRYLRRFLAHRDDVLLVAASLFGLSLVAASLAFYRAPNVEDWAASGSGAITLFLYCALLSLLYAVPFACAGLVLGMLLSDPELPTRRVYFWDLAGSSFGAFSVIPAIRTIGVEASALMAASVMLVAGLALTRPRRGAARAVAGACAIVLVLAFAQSSRLFVMTYPHQSYLGMTQDPASGYAVEALVWDPVARIEVLRTPPPDPKTFPWPALIGTNEAFLSRFRRMLTQNNNAYTYAVEYDGNRESLAGIEETLYAAAYETTSVTRPRVLVIGVGGGFDILTGLYFDAAEITGVEINAATIRIVSRLYRDYFRPWVEDPRVRLVEADGRHHLAADQRQYDVIQLSGVDSVSGTPGAAHVFSENYLYTAEAFDLYLSRLTEAGIVNLMRLEYIPPREMLRALTTAVEALRRAGIQKPSDHVLMLASNNGSFTAMLLKRRPFTAEEVTRVRAWSEASSSFKLAAAPGMALPGNLYQTFLALGDPGTERAFALVYPFDVRPVGDDRPFFFRYSYWSHLFSRDPVVQASVPVMEYGLLVLFAITSLAAIACVYVPLRYLAKEGTSMSGATRYGVFFGGIGLGYLAMEVALLQKFGLFLGHPNYALSVVLAALLLASGLGSLWSAQITRALGNLRYVSYLLAALVLVECLVVFPRLSEYVGLAFPVRVAIVLALTLPLGVCMGTFFPSALESIKASSPGFGPWAWGLNGIFSVVAPVLSVGTSMTFGINALLLSAIPVYLVAALSLPDAATAS
jgi:spermidine synthase